MLSSLLVGVLSAVLADAGSQSSTATEPPAKPAQAAPIVHTEPQAFALTLPGGTLCFGQPKNVRCDRHWPMEPAPAPKPVAGAGARKSWHFTVLDRTLCFGDVPRSVPCTVRLDPAAVANRAAAAAANKTAS
jgi:hypothetical protein